MALPGRPLILRISITNSQQVNGLKALSTEQKHSETSK
ncbi:hypothetical protein P20429_2118 [Pseudoalteromonas sp. BSi20429]|nr:hypothetical protein P20429_2118 [Pseudoalteromonas sp. BSi20429]